ncbi:hypothetical protein SAMN02745130_03942 [Thiothrix eikelboomii]|jgi:hypothetical protein|uniref:Uncharacterized protein n=1 Tax=Thiothrix eikelboomii TaxID=92487 RepID=A0A1T4Y6S9_9GAMM|nr:hypothetical protein [Thiothrix eikelboomii]SKA96965.1 hypothetical protein SAMN02745130_03942 [Thiothrix eikelboomii]
MSNLNDDMRPEYDFSGGVRGKHYQQGTNVVLLDPDVAAHFKDAQAVNHALRLLIQLAGQEVKPKIDVTDKAA